MSKRRRGRAQKPRRWPRLAYTPFAGEDRRNSRRLLIITLVITILAILGLWFESTLPDPPPKAKPEEPVRVSLIVPPPGMFEIPAAFEVEAAPKPVHARRRSRPGRRPDLTRTRAPSDPVYVPEDARADRVAATWDDEDDDEETTHGERVAQDAPPAPPPPPPTPIVAPARSPATPAVARRPVRKPTHASRRVTVVTESKPRAQPKPRRPRPVGRRPSPDNVVIVGSGGTDLEELNAQPILP